MYDFELIRPRTLAEAVAALADPEAQALAGGQTLIPTLKARLAAPARLVALGALPELRDLRREGDFLVIGAAMTHAEVARGARAHCPALADLAGGIGDPAVRNRGTLGGSLANNDPAACYPAAALGLGAAIITTEREIVADAYFQGLFTTALRSAEIVTAVRFPLPVSAAYLKFPQPASRFALAGVFVARFPDRVRVAVTGVSQSGVFRWTEAEEVLCRSFEAAALEGLAIPPDNMIGDIHGSPDYRAHLIAVLTRRAVTSAG